jgi:C-terminal region of peptidase_M24
VIWLNDYHARVKTEVTPFLVNDAVALKWLDARTQPYKAPCNDGNIKKFPMAFTIISIVIACGVN